MTPESPDWINFSQQEIWQMNQLPNEIIETISLPGLLETCLTFPFYGDIGLVDYPQDGFDYMVNHFNGLFELLNKQSCSIEIFDRYKSMSPLCEYNNYPSFLGRGGSIGMSFIAIEMLLAQYSVLDQFEPEQLKAIAKEALLKYDQKLLNSSTKSIMNIEYTLLICGRILKSDNYQPFITELNNNVQLELFLDKVFLRSIEIIEIIHSNTISYIENH